MWHFDKGAFGVVCVVLSLFASVLFGVVTNVSSETVERDRPDYVTDISGLYQSTNDRSYVDYDPAANFNGYTIESRGIYNQTGTRSTTVSSGTDVHGSYYIVYGDDIPRDKAVYYITTDDTCSMTIGGNTITGRSFGPFVQSGAERWVWVNNGATIQLTPADFRINSELSPTLYHISYSEYKTFDTTPPSPYTMAQYTIPLNGSYSLRYVVSGVAYYLAQSNVNVTATYTYVESTGLWILSIGGTTISNVSDLKIATTSGNVTFTGVYSAIETKSITKGASYFPTVYVESASTGGVFGMTYFDQTMLSPEMGGISMPFFMVWEFNDATYGTNLPQNYIYVAQYAGSVSPTPSASDQYYYHDSTYSNQIILTLRNEYGTSGGNSTYHYTADHVSSGQTPSDIYYTYSGEFPIRIITKISNPPAPSSPYTKYGDIAGVYVSTMKYAPTGMWGTDTSYEIYNLDGTSYAGHTARGNDQYTPIYYTDIGRITYQNGTITYYGTDNSVKGTTASATFNEFAYLPKTISGSYNVRHTSSGTGTFTPNTTTITASGHESGVLAHQVSYGSGIPSNEIYAFYYIETSSTATLSDATGNMAGSHFGPYYATSDTSWRWSSRNATTSQFSVTSQSENEFTVKAIGFTSITRASDYDMIISSTNTVVRLLINGSHTYLHYTNTVAIQKSGTTYTINNVEYQDVSGIDAATYEDTSFTYNVDSHTYPVNFKPSQVANNYRFTYNEDVTVSRDVDITTEYTTESGDTGLSESVYPFSIVLSPTKITPNVTMDSHDIYVTGWNGTYSKINLGAILTNEITYSDNYYPNATRITLSIPITYDIVTYDKTYITSEYPYGNVTHEWHYRYVVPDNFMGFAKETPDDPQSALSGFPYSLPIEAYDPNLVSPPYITDRSTNIKYTDGETKILRCEYNKETEMCSIYFDDKPVYTDIIPSDYALYYPTSSLTATNRLYDGNISLIEAYPDLTATSDNAFIASYVSGERVSYLDARYGVNVRSGEQAVWMNGYANEKITYVAMLGAVTDELTNIPEIDLNRDYMTTFDLTYEDTNPLYTDLADRSRITIIHEGGGQTYIYLDDFNGTPQAVATYGSSWVAFEITVDGVTGKVSVAPISADGWTSFLIYQTSNTPETIQYLNPATNKMEDYSLRNKGEIYGMVLTTSGQIYGDAYRYTPVRFQIMKTSVYLNTHGVIMVDAQLDIMKYYPLNEKFMITIKDTAATGTSMFIGGTEYVLGATIPLDNNRTKTIEENEIYIDGKVLNVEEMEISYYLQENGTYNVDVYSNRSRNGVTLTDVTDTKLGFEGAWYFTSDYYKIVKKAVDEYDWDVSLGYGYSGVVLFMMVFLGGIFLIWRRLQPEMFGTLDIAIIIGAEIILFIILV